MGGPLGRRWGAVAHVLLRWCFKTSALDYYEILGIPRDATEDQVKSAYRKLARRYHPDVNPNDPTAEQKFKEVAEAYQVLSDPERRARYDRYGHDANGGYGGFGSDFAGFDPFSIFDAFFGEGTFGRTTRNGPQRGSDLRADIELELEEAAFGATKELKVSRMAPCDKCGGTGAKPGSSPVVCSTCHGRGQVQTVQTIAFGRFTRVEACPKCHGEGKIIESPCSQCQGAGRVRLTDPISVEIPAGVDNGSRIVVRGLGEGGVRGGPPGDLHIFIHVRPHEIFERDGMDLIAEAEVPFASAALGTELEVPTLDGPAKLKVPEGTQPGTILTLKGKGVQSTRGYGRGDLHVRIKVVTPTRLSDREREILREFSLLRGEPAAEASKNLFQRIKDKWERRA